MIEIFEKFHSTGWVYNDIKPDNFCIGFTDDERHVLKLIDFGLSTRYLTNEGKHIKYSIGSVNGNLGYRSPHSFKNIV